MKKRVLLFSIVFSIVCLCFLIGCKSQEGQPVETQPELRVAYELFTGTGTKHGIETTDSIYLSHADLGVTYKIDKATDTMTVFEDKALFFLDGDLEHGYYQDLEVDTVYRIQLKDRMWTSLGPLSEFEHLVLNRSDLTLSKVTLEAPFYSLNGGNHTLYGSTYDQIDGYLYFRVDSQDAFGLYRVDQMGRQFEKMPAADCAIIDNNTLFYTQAAGIEAQVSGIYRRDLSSQEITRVAEANARALQFFDGDFYYIDADQDALVKLEGDWQVSLEGLSDYTVTTNGIYLWSGESLYHVISGGDTLQPVSRPVAEKTLDEDRIPTGNADVQAKSSSAFSAISGDWAYYSIPEHSGVFKENLITGDRVKVSDQMAVGLQVIENVLYYIGENASGEMTLEGMDLRTDKLQTLYSGENLSSLHVDSKGLLFYADYKRNLFEGRALVRVPFEGGPPERRLMNGNDDAFAVQNDQLYIQNKNQIWRTDFSLDKLEVVFEGSPEAFVVMDQVVYAMKSADFDLVDGRLYYIGDDGNLYQTDGQSESLVISGSGITAFDVMGDWIFYVSEGQFYAVAL